MVNRIFRRRMPAAESGSSKKVSDIAKRKIGMKAKFVSKPEREATKIKRTSKSARAGLQFPVTKFHRLLKQGRYAKRVSPSAAVYLSAVIEYLSAEMLELSGNACRDNCRHRLVPRHIVLAIKNDEELNQFCAKVTCPQGGVLPFVHPILFAKGGNTQPLRAVRRISTASFSE
ncbi:hypothetical protein AB6A40_006622 [Gnathostoma spinigerum]|uniref:Histone H2A n=1 Tax=Gnathostoma spinigerum TaxID=75299 RepID=A0ABD6EIV9_9BILA